MLKQFIVEERIEKIEKQKDVGRAKKLTIISAFLQHCLGEVLEIPAAEVRFSYGPWGKPALQNSDLDFSLSHSGNYAVLAVSDALVGIDVEHLRRDRLHIAKRFFYESEYRDIDRLSDEREKNIRFLEYWTMKEAYVKRAGKGLQIPLDSFVITRDLQQSSRTVSEDGTEIWFATHFLKDSYAVSICSEKKRELEMLKKENFREILFADLKKEGMSIENNTQKDGI
ncbi:MAG: 4'-phosphopantetheinyl transferase superfamily protein [Eubacteriales bacterium]|nr:4'-phosphopantetheinyl transferase superfamily protein [Eubacteriales bacterium]